MKIAVKCLAKTDITVSGTETHEDMVAEITRLIIDGDRLRQCIVVHFPEDYFLDGSDRLSVVKEWIDKYLFEVGAIPDMVWIDDPLNGLVAAGTVFVEGWEKFGHLAVVP